MTEEQLDQTTETIPCVACGIAFDYHPYTIGVRFKRTECTQCAEQFIKEWEKKEKADEQEKKQAEAMARHESRWNELCPKLFRDTDASRLPAMLATAATDWQTDSSKVLALIGASGTGKTRAAFLALRAAHDSGMHCEAITHSALSKCARDAAFGDNTADARTRMEELEACDVLLVDDLGKPPSTERADADLEALIDYRYANCLPTIWTANSGGAWLASRFGSDRGKPLVRRLTQNALIVSL